MILKGSATDKVAEKSISELARIRMMASNSGGFQVLLTNQASLTVSDFDRTCNFLIKALGF
ncbi:MAG: hypothetical protein CFH10_00863 [Alphaproteobacteria bacterium MarineAlpha4_Bin2]|nr:MAG: hypothetical protein CFH10_00863 [Alphaproteobacteria bacterium MarineAlpha4_Bin2]